ncbi:antitoxin [Streptomonospora salina]|uniref:ABC-type phosphonate transport system ATPase subunit n=1 Tax=Streptomonospora salina TaxID=104205 RepID=A0A841E9V0_9ACTN|nr:antitoxin [Streptomonospora salina]MBB5999895.1 ABC-type phosphonate transport system ATPase subunit [Streptomonospora salina]
MANLQRLLRQALGFIRKNPRKANRYLHTASETVKKRTGGRYNRHIDKATGMASKHLAKQSGRPDQRARDDRNLQHRSGGSVPEYRPDGPDHRRDR